MEDNSFDVIIVGAGPAGLFLAREVLLHSPSKKIAIIDNGRSLTKRVCPLIDQGKCTQCRTCHVAYGVGGAGMFSDGKLSLWPAGSGLQHLLDNKYAVLDLNRYVADAFLKGVQGNSHSTSGESAEKSSLVEGAAKCSLQVKCYDVYHLGTEGIQEYCGSLEKEMIEKGVKLLDTTTCLDVEKFGRVFVVTVKTVRGQNVKLVSNKVALATGKASGLVLRRILKKLGVNFEFNAIELGVRVETNRQSVTEISECHLDAKIKLSLPEDTEVRSFCLCSGGYLVSCYYDGFLEGDRLCTISGFSFRDKKSDNANFGILVRKKFPPQIDPISVQMGIVQSINRASGTGATVVQRYEDFVSNRPTSQSALDGNSVRSTLNPIAPTNLRWIMPDYVVSSIEAYLKHLSELAPGINSKDTLLHAPVWELCSDRVMVNKGSMATNIPGLYVIGDASGWARGIIQAATTGVVAGRNMLESWVG